VRYEVYDAWAAARLGEHTENDPEPGEMAEEIQAVYSDAAIRGGRVIACHTVVLEGSEYLFFVSEFPGEPETTESV
jgi:hypothetical protein